MKKIIRWIKLKWIAFIRWIVPVKEIRMKMKMTFISVKEKHPPIKKKIICVVEDEQHNRMIKVLEYNINPELKGFWEVSNGMKQDYTDKVIQWIVVDDLLKYL